MPKTIIKIENLVKDLKGRRVLDGIDLEIFEGETFVIMGCSGCGKSTLLRHLSGALKPDAGSVFIKGKEIAKIDEAGLEQIKKRFGMLFQSAALLDSLSVEENVGLPLEEHTKLTPDIIKIIVKMKLSLVGLRGFEKYLPAELSGGMKKRVGLARAIAMDPDIIFYDEPTAGLDPVVAAVIDRLILDLGKKLLITSVVVTHDMQSAFRIADRVAMMHKGRILQVGTAEEIKNSADPIVRQFISGDVEGPIQSLSGGVENG
jgi:phospholipid/cholesterol/gamma-HCH transport system ATP-binding protein